MDSILIVDDNPENLKVLSNMLEKEGYDTRVAMDGEKALESIQAEAPDLVLLDIQMPKMDGYQVCHNLKSTEKYKMIPIIFISALNEVYDKVKAFQVGGVDYITKPFQFEEVSARVNTHLKIDHLQKELEKHNRNLKQIVKEQVKEISDAQLSTIMALIKISEDRDYHTGQHLERTRNYCKTVAVELMKNGTYPNIVNEEFIEIISQASTLHDLGKVGIPDSILLKPGKLTPEEFETMKTHTSTGANTLLSVIEKYPKNEFLKMGFEIAGFHHEKWDGTGYPDGLLGKAIPLSARIMALADVYDALRSERVYKKAFSHDKSKNILVEGKSSHFDPLLIDVFLKLEEEFQKTYKEFT